MAKKRLKIAVKKDRFTFTLDIIKVSFQTPIYTLLHQIMTQSNQIHYTTKQLSSWLFFYRSFCHFLWDGSYEICNHRESTIDCFWCH